MANAVDRAVTTLSKIPWFSVVTVVPATIAAAQVDTGEATSAGLVSLTFMVAAGIPATTWFSIAAAVNLFRDRSCLSKAFSLVSGATSAVALPQFAMSYSSGDEQKLLFAVSLTAVASASNIVAHYSRNSHRKQDVAGPSNEQS